MGGGDHCGIGHRADFTAADLTAADFTGANLSGEAKFEFAHLNGTILNGADLAHANFLGGSRVLRSASMSFGRAPKWGGCKPG